MYKSMYISMYVRTEYIYMSKNKDKYIYIYIYVFIYLLKYNIYIDI